MNTIVIPTTQNIELEYPIATLGDRIFAALLDLLVLACYWSLLYMIFDIAALPPFIARAFGVLEPANQLLFLPIMFYHLICEIVFNGQSLGKTAMKIKVIRLDGAPATVIDYLIRWMFRLVDVSVTTPFIGVVGIISIAVTKKGQRIGDMLANTTVIKLKMVTYFADTIFVETEDDYQVVFPEIEGLSDRDVSILKEVLDAGLKSNNPELLLKLESRVKSVTGIKSKLHTKAFLETVLKDYNYLYGQTGR